MTAKAIMFLVRVDDHRHRVPTNQALDASLDFAVAGIFRLFGNGNRVDVRRADRTRHLQAGAAQPVHESFQEERSALLALHAQDQFEKILNGFKVMARALPIAAQRRERARRARFANRVGGELSHGRLINFQIVTHKRLKLNDAQIKTKR